MRRARRAAPRRGQCDQPGGTTPAATPSARSRAEGEAGAVFAPAGELADLPEPPTRRGRRACRDATLAPEAADLHHSLGLLLVRRKDLAGALVELKRAAELAADDPDAQYTYAVALYSSGRLADAIALLDKTWRAHPGDRQVLAALVSYVREQGDGVRARDLASRLVALSPGDPSAAGLFEEIRKESQ